MDKFGEYEIKNFMDRISEGMSTSHCRICTNDSCAAAFKFRFTEGQDHLVKYETLADAQEAERMASGPQNHMYSVPENHFHFWTSYLHRPASALALQGLGLLGVTFVNLVSSAGSHGCCIAPASHFHASSRRVASAPPRALALMTQCISCRGFVP